MKGATRAEMLMRGMVTQNSHPTRLSHTKKRKAYPLAWKHAVSRRTYQHCRLRRTFAVGWQGQGLSRPSK